jgi:hypothetical protein
MKLKRHISILLTTLILFSNIGLALNVHYCHGRVSSVSVAYRVKDACAKVKKLPVKTCCAAAAKKLKPCCKNSVLKLQDKTDSIVIKALQLNLASFYVAEGYKPLHFFKPALAVVKKDTPSFYCESHAPPLFKLYCRYIFYA